jgi:hypothetical protein
MAIAFGAHASSGFLNTTTNNFSYTQAAGTDRLLVIYVYSSADVVSAVTFNGDSATFVNKRLMTGAAAGQYINMWYLLNPDVTTANITVTSSGNLGGFITGVSYTGVLQSTQPDVELTNGSTSTTSLTTTLTTTVDNDWIMGYAYHNGTVVAGANTTLRGGPNAVLQSFDTNAAQTPAGNHSVTTTRSPADFAGHVTAAFKPAVSFTPTPMMHMMGITGGLV